MIQSDYRNKFACCDDKIWPIWAAWTFTAAVNVFKWLQMAVHRSLSWACPHCLADYDAAHNHTMTNIRCFKLFIFIGGPIGIISYMISWVTETHIHQMVGKPSTQSSSKAANTHIVRVMLMSCGEQELKRLSVTSYRGVTWLHLASVNWTLTKTESAVISTLWGPSWRMVTSCNIHLMGELGLSCLQVSALWQSGV